MDRLAAVNRAALWVAVLTLIGFSMLSALVIRAQPQGILSFAYIGTRFSLGDPNGTVGYDGQFAYFIARDGAQAIPYIDGPSLRYQRILYPLVARVLAFGNAEWVPWTLLLVNLIAHTVASGVLALLIGRLGGNPWSALVYSVWIGNMFAVRLDLNEPLFMALALLAVLAYTRERWRTTIVLLVLSTAAKELGIVLALGLALHMAVTRGKWRWASLIVGAPLLYFGVWWGVMRIWLGRLPLGYPAAKVEPLPFLGMFTMLHDPLQFGMLVLWLGIPTLLLLIAAGRVLWRTRTLSLSIALLLPALLFVMTMPDVSWQDPVAAYRVALPLIPTGLLFVAEHAPQRARLLAALWIPASLVALLLPGFWI